MANMGGRNVIRELLVSLGIKVDPRSNLNNFNKAVEETKTRMELLGRTALDAGKWVAAGITAAIGAGAALVLTTAATAQNIERQSKALGLTTDEFQQYAGVFAKFGADSKEISEAFLQITEKVVDLGNGSQETVQQFSGIGLSYAKLKGKRPGEVFELVADALAKTTDRQKALGTASKLFGEDTAKKLLPALTQGGAAIRKMREEVSALGGVMTRQQLAVLGRVGDQWRMLKTQLTGVRNTLAAALAPTMERILVSLNRWLTANRALLAQRIAGWANALERALVGVDRAVRLVGGWDTVFAAAAAGAGMLLLLANLEKVEKLIAAVRTAMLALDFVGMATIGAPLVPFLLVLGGLLLMVGLVALAVDDFVVSMEGGRSVIGSWLDAIGSVVPGFESFRDLMDATVELAKALWRNLGRLGDALLVGLKPALDVMVTVFETFEGVLSRVWGWLDRISSGPNERIAALFRGIAGDLDSASPKVAGVLGNVMAGSVGSAVASLSGALSGGDSSVRTSTTHATFYGPTQHEVGAALDIANRKARVAVQGGER